MSVALLFDVGLGLLLLAVATAAVTGRDIFAAIVSFIAYGLLVAVAWVRLEAVDVALAEAALGAGLTGALLVGGWARLRRSFSGDQPEQSSGSDDPPPAALGRAFVALLSTLITAGLAWAILALPPAEPGLAPAVEEALPRTGVENPVTGVLLAFRAYDTLLESMVILTALVAVWAVTPRGFWGGQPGLPLHARPDGVLATFGRLLPPTGLVVAVYLVWAGSTLPGGAFQAGTVLAAVLLLTAMAGLAEPPAVTSPWPRILVVLGPTVFLAIGLAGAFIGPLLALPEGWSKPMIVLVELGLTLSIGVTLALIVLGPPRRPAATLPKPEPEAGAGP